MWNKNWEWKFSPFCPLNENINLANNAVSTHTKNFGQELFQTWHPLTHVHGKTVITKYFNKYPKTMYKNIYMIDIYICICSL